MNANLDLAVRRGLSWANEMATYIGPQHVKEIRMSYARINIVEFNSEEFAKAEIKDFASSAAAEFPEAEIIVSVATGAESVVIVSVYPDEDAFERSAVARAARLKGHEERFKNVEVLEGEVALAHVKPN